MAPSLRVLFIEDSDDDAALVLRALSEAGYTISARRVDTAAAMRAALDEQPWDVALVDYVMPQFSGLEALRFLQDRGLDVPRIMISGAMGEEAAADVMRCGAHDLILKHNLGRLVPAVERELREAQERRKRREAEEALERSRRELRIWSSIAEVFLTVPDEEMYARVLGVILEALDSERGVVGYVDEQGDLICPAMNRRVGEEPESAEAPVAFPRQTWRGIWSRALSARTAVCQDEAPSGRGQLPLRPPIAAPIIHQGEIIGILEVSNKPTDYTADDRRLLEDMADRIAPVLHARLQRNREEIERRRAHETLAAERERLAVTLRSIGDGVITTDTQGLVAIVNRLAECLTGWSQADAAGKTLTEVFAIAHERTHQPCANPLQRVLETEQIVSLSENAELLARDGSTRPIAGTAAPVRDADSTIIGVVVVFRDMSEKRRMDEAMLRASKMESLTLLAGGIGHDFNNVLTALMGNISLARRRAQPGDGIFERLMGAEKACVQAKGLTQQLLTFAKGGAPVRTTASLAELLRDCAHFVLRGSAVRCELCIPDDLWPVEVAEGQISQVINNLLINAKEAMPNGGTITVCAENVDLDAHDGLSLSPGDYVRVRIVDQGSGIPPEHLHLIFDPYFTTKPEGSGLGLATAQSIVRRHDGEMVVESELGVGTSFHLYLPAAPGDIIPVSPGTAGPSAPPGLRGETGIMSPGARPGRGKVLVMEDQETVRELAGEMLVHLGYEVGFASNGAEAIEQYAQARDRGEPFDAVVMDLTIPGAMGGKEAIQRLRQLHPDVRAIVSSGYSTDPIMTEFSKHGFCACVAKPYRIEELGEALHAAIMGASQPGPQ